MRYFLYEVKHKWWLFFLLVIIAVLRLRNQSTLSGYIGIMEGDIILILALYLGNILSNGEELELIKSTGTKVRKVFYVRVAVGYLYAIAAALLVAIYYAIHIDASVYEMIICIVSFLCSSFAISSLAVFLHILTNNAYVSHVFCVAFLYAMRVMYFSHIKGNIPKEFMLVMLEITVRNFAGTLWWLNRLIYFSAGAVFLIAGMLLFNICFARKEHLHAN